MQAWQQRVIDEQRALDEKLEKLEAFLDSEVGQNLDKSRLCSEAFFMNAYSAAAVY